jgi:hypothetical protein
MSSPPYSGIENHIFRNQGLPPGNTLSEAGNTFPEARAARLWEIAENLHRAELTALELSEHVAEGSRKTCCWSNVARGRAIAAVVLTWNIARADRGERWTQISGKVLWRHVKAPCSSPTARETSSYWNCRRAAVASEIREGASR